MQYLKDTKTNVVYNLYTFRSKPNHLNSNTEKIRILGKEYCLTKDNEKEVNKEVEEELNSIVWFCYRKNFEPIHNQLNNQQLSTDSGWGCMIRVGQMMLYIVLNRMLNKEKSVEKKYAILRKYFKEHAKKELAEEEVNKLEEILGNFESLETDDKEIQFVEEKTDANEVVEENNIAEVKETSQLEEDLSSKHFNKLYNLSQVANGHKFNSLNAKDKNIGVAVDSKEEEFEPTNMTNRLDQLDFSAKLFIDDHNSCDEVLLDDDKSDEEELNKHVEDDLKESHIIKDTNIGNEQGYQKVDKIPEIEDILKAELIVTDLSIKSIGEPTVKTTVVADNKPENQDKDSFSNSSKKDISEKQICKQSLGDTYDISNKFDLFSLQHIVLRAQEFLDTVPGSWFRPTTFLIVIRKLIKRYFKEVRVVNVIENTILLGKIYKSVFGSKNDMPTTVPEIVEELSNKTWNNRLLLSISTMLGLENMEPRYKYFLDTLIASKSFCGVLGGRHQSAYFIIGNNDRGSYYYLDPHYVKDTVIEFSDPKILEQEFFKKNLLEIDYSKLSTSVSLIFFLESCEDFKSLWNTLNHLEDYYKDDYFMSYMISNDINDAEYAEDDIITF